MSLILFLGRNIKIILTIVVVVIGILYKDELQLLYKSWNKVEVKIKAKDKSVFTEQELSTYNGDDKKKLYLSLLGNIYDVTKGKKHYGKNGSYHYFIGKDGSRAFVTGNFKDETKNRDHVIDLSCDDMLSLLHWKDTLEEKYKPVGVLIGRYYDEAGQPTVYSKQLSERLDKCNTEKEVAKLEEQKYPPCNMEWSVDQGSRVWCTKTSGGVNRGWAGVPRQLYTPGEDKPRCVCINLVKDNSQALLKEYDNCKPDSYSCIINS